MTVIPSVGQVAWSLFYAGYFFAMGWYWRGQRKDKR